MLYLTPHTFCARVESQLVFLDLLGDRYHCLPPKESREVGPLLFAEGPAPSAGDIGSVVSALSKANLVTEDRRRGKRPEPTARLALSADLMSYPIAQEADVGATDVLRLVRAASMTALRLRTMSLAKIADRLRRRKTRSSPRQVDSTPTVPVEIFKRLRPLLFTAKNQCLYDSLVMIEFLAGYGFFPTWVMAVMMGPFSAHSWVQDETTVYNDEVANVARFTPILTV